MRKYAGVVIYVLSFLIVGTYVLLVLGRVPESAFHWANALGGPPIIALTCLTVGWQPMLALTVAFTTAGWIGVLT